jgi:predicted signal transduction protein with EAL and GGDEF domain
MRSDADAACAIIAVDLTDLDAIAKSVGTTEAESVAVQAARRLQRRANLAGHRIARVGAQRFVVCVPGVERGIDVATFADDLITELRQPYELSTSSLSLDVAVGIAVSPSDGTDADTLVRHAEHAVPGSSQRIGFYSAAGDAAARRRLEFAGEVSIALEAGDFVPFYQPIVRSHRRDVVAFEVLARWRHAQRGVLLPAEFLGTLEARGLLSALDGMLMLSSCRWVATLDSDPATSISVNVSAAAFEQVDFPSQVRRAVRTSGLDPRRLQIEITESTAMRQVSHTRTTLAMLRDEGVRIALDDFGTGYSSLGQLRDLPVDTLKIDRGFVQSALHDVKTAAIVETIVVLARNLGLDVVAEGIETEEEAIHFTGLGATHLQGFYFAPAVAADMAERMNGVRFGPNGAAR